MSGRTHIDSYGNVDYRMDGNVVIASCKHCSTFRYPFCQATDEDIPYPVTGPVGKKCPLPKYVRPEDKE